MFLFEFLVMRLHCHLHFVSHADGRVVNRDFYRAPSRS